MLLFIVFFSTTSKDTWKYTIKTLPKGSKIIAFGDSLTFGYQLPIEHSYPSLLQKELKDKYEIINYGVSGDTTLDGLNRFEDMIVAEKPSMIILGLGGNDVLRRISQDTTKRNLTNMIDISKKYKIPIVLLPNPGPSVSGFLLGFKDYQLFEDISKEKEIPVLKNTLSKWLSKDKYKIDKIHLNKEGYSLLAKDIKEQLLKNKVIKD